MSWSERTARRRRRRALVGLPIAAMAAALAQGCGFKLRAPPQMPFRRIALTGFPPRSPLAEALRQSLSPAVEVLETGAQAEVVLVALQDAREKSVVATTAAVQVREVQLRSRLNFRIEAPGGRVLLPPTQLLLSRDMSYNETQALAKEEEEAQLYREMQADLVAQVLRRLSALKL
jgi:LPS-assembly lipoprotein